MIKKILAGLVPAFLFTNFVCAKVLLNEKVGKSIEIFSFKDVCENFGFKENVLIDAKGLTQLDCTSRMVGITDFCLKKFPKKNLTRGVLAPVPNQIHCEFASDVKLKIECSDLGINCKDPKATCQTLKGSYAKNLSMINSFVLHDELTCLYSSP